jgi:hypothetical protein
MSRQRLADDLVRYEIARRLIADSMINYGDVSIFSRACCTRLGAGIVTHQTRTRQSNPWAGV